MKTFPLLFVAVIACGGSQPPPPTVPLPDEPKPAEATPTAAANPPPAPAKPAEPTTIPIDLSIAAPDTAVKLVKPGMGKKAVIKLAAAQGAKQHVDLLLDFSEKNLVEQQPPQEVVAPTVVLSGDVEAGAAGTDGATPYKLTITGQDAKDRPGSQVTAQEFKAQQMGDITGLVLSGSVAPNGKVGETKLHIDKADRKAADMVGLIDTLMQPLWPELPTEPVGVGAKWTVTLNTKIVDKVAITRTTDWEVVGHKDNTWQLKGTTKVAGKDQTVDDASVSKIGGGGTIDVTLTDGALVPQTQSTMSSEFTAKVTLPAEAGSAAGQQKSAQVKFEQGFGVAPAAPATASK